MKENAPCFLPCRSLFAGVVLLCATNSILSCDDVSLTLCVGDSNYTHTQTVASRAGAVILYNVCMLAYMLVVLLCRPLAGSEPASAVSTIGELSCSAS